MVPNLPVSPDALPYLPTSPDRVVVDYIDQIAGYKEDANEQFSTLTTQTTTKASKLSDTKHNLHHIYPAALPKLSDNNIVSTSKLNEEEQKSYLTLSPDVPSKTYNIKDSVALIIKGDTVNEEETTSLYIPSSPPECSTTVYVPSTLDSLCPQDATNTDHTTESNISLHQGNNLYIT